MAKGVVIIPGDDAAPEAMFPTVEILKSLAPAIEFVGFPSGTELSATMMLDYWGFADAAQKLEEAVSAVYLEGRYLTLDQGGRGLTTEFCQAVKRHL
jgi:isocitrate/isopropylmalate dehydrogenase